MNDPTELRKYIHSIEDEKTLTVLHEMFSDALSIISLREKIAQLENSLFEGDRMEHMMTLAPFEENEEALHLAVTVLQGKVNTILEKRAEEAEKELEAFSETPE